MFSHIVDYYRLIADELREAGFYREAEDVDSTASEYAAGLSY